MWEEVPALRFVLCRSGLWRTGVRRFFVFVRCFIVLFVFVGGRPRRFYPGGLQRSRPWPKEGFDPCACGFVKIVLAGQPSELPVLLPQKLLHQGLFFFACYVQAPFAQKIPFQPRPVKRVQQIYDKAQQCRIWAFTDKKRMQTPKPHDAAINRLHSSHQSCVDPKKTRQGF